MLKLRTSNGLRVQRFLGNFCDRADTEADLGGLDSEKSLLAVLQHDGNTIKEGEDLHVQVALLFTTALGDRRIRVHNLRLVGTDNLQAVFRHADIDSIVAYMVREGTLQTHYCICCMEVAVRVLYCRRGNGPEERCAGGGQRDE